MNALSSDLDYLAGLAHCDDVADRDHLLRSLCAVMISPETVLSTKKRTLCGSLICNLLAASTIDQQIEIAERIADAPSLTSDVARRLAFGHIAGAALVIERYRHFTDQDLIEIANICGADHCAAIAARPDLSVEVSRAVIDNGEEDALKVLINNHSVQISREDMGRLVAIAKRFPVLALPLLQRPNLRPQDGAKIAEAGSEAVRALIARLVPTESPEDDRTDDENDVEGDLSDQIQRYQKSGRLRLPMLIKALHDSNENLFVDTLSVLSGLTNKSLKRLLQSNDTGALALAYRAAGGTQTQFETVCAMYRVLKGLSHEFSAKDRRQIETVFRTLDRQKAFALLQGLE